MERVDLRDPMGEQDLALIAPVDLRLRTGHDLEPAMQARQARIVVAGQPLAGLGHIQLHPLVVPGEPVLGDETLVDHAGLEPRIGG